MCRTLIQSCIIIIHFKSLPTVLLNHLKSLVGDRVIDVGSEWRTFSNEKALKDPSRVGDAQNPLLNGGDLTTMIGKVGGTQFTDYGRDDYRKNQLSWLP